MPFSTTLAPTDLARYVARQMATFFPDGDEMAAVERVMKDALGRLEHCFNHARLKCFWSETGPRFNHLHTDQSAIFLYSDIPRMNPGFGRDHGLHCRH